MESNMFLDNKYSKWYSSIINNAKDRNLIGYTEKHHIIPKSLGGNNKQSNLVKLTAREHFLCHLLLVKMTVGDNKRKMQFAVGKFIQVSPYQNRKFTSWEYKKIRENLSCSRKGISRTEETCKKISEKLMGKTPHNKGQIGVITQTEEFKKNLSVLYSGKTYEERYGDNRAAEIKTKIATSKLGKPSGMLGKSHPRKGTKGMWTMSDEGKKNVSQARIGIIFSEIHLENLREANIQNGLRRRGKKQEIITCVHCGKTGGATGITRYHNDNCKFKET